MASFYSEKSQALFDNIVWLPQKGAKAGPSGRPPNSYAILVRNFSVLIDAAYSWNMPGIEQLVNAGQRPSALVLTHADVAEQGDAIAEIHRTYDVPVLLHPADASLARSRRAGVEFADPTKHSALDGAWLDVIHIPGHTPGSIMLHTKEHEGILFTGDAAVAPGPHQPAEPPRLERPKIAEEDDAAFREQWHVLCAHRFFSSALPLHGTPYVRRGDMRTIHRSLYEGAPMDPGSPAEGEPNLIAAGVPHR